MFDLTDSYTFDKVKDWLVKVQDVAREEIPIVIIGNKIDLEQDRTVNSEDIIKLAQDNGMSSYEISSL